MRNRKLYGILMILVGILSISTGMALLTTAVSIQSTGRIGITTTNTGYSSEIRGVFVWESIYAYSHDWNVIAQALHQYNMNAMFVADATGTERRPDSEISAAIAACHANGIEYHSVMMVIRESHTTLPITAIEFNGQIHSQYDLCPIKAHDTVIASVQSYLTAHPTVDGLMYDHLRYDYQSVCYCPQCRAAFEAWLGEGPIADWTPFYPDGSRWLEYAEWRTIPVNTLAKDIRNAALAIKPNLTISQTPWTLFSNTPTYWRKYLGQDVGALIKDDVLDFVAPQMYTKDISGTSGETLQSEIDANLKYLTAGPEGKILLVAALRNDYTSTDPTPAEFKAEIDYVRSRGLDGWIIYRYGGPGDGEPNPDITQYLAVLDMPQTFTINNIQVATGSDYATISWATDLPTTSKVEYSTSPLFNATWRILSGFSYWGIDHVEGIIVENSTAVINHDIRLAGLLSGTEYYFRVQSQDPSGNATSKVLKFTTGS
jgi:hypothetical protein